MAIAPDDSLFDWEDLNGERDRLCKDCASDFPESHKNGIFNTAPCGICWLPFRQYFWRSEMNRWFATTYICPVCARMCTGSQLCAAAPMGPWPCK